MNGRPKVIVVCIVYNQEAFIRDALNGFVVQDCNFDYQVIVADDNSTDKTQDIIKEYQKRYPGIIKPIMRKKNIGAWENMLDTLIKSSNADYIALCEGDDYWTDPRKLQKQVDFMDKRLDYSVCFHPVTIIYENKEQADSIFPEKKTGFTLKELLKGNFIQTNSVMYRTQSNYKNLAKDVMPGDWYLHAYHAQFGKIGLIDDTMAVYRKHDKGIWWNSSHDKEMFWTKNASLHMNLYEQFLFMFGENGEYSKIIASNAVNTLQDIYKSLPQTNPSTAISKDLTKLLEAVVRESIMQLNNNQIERRELNIQKIGLETELVKTTKSLRDITNSKSYKIVRKFQMISSKIKQ